MLNHLFPFIVIILEARTLAISMSSLKSQFSSSTLPFPVSRSKVSQTLDSLADFSE